MNTHPMDIYRKVREDLTLTNREFDMLAAHEDMLVQPMEKKRLPRYEFLGRCTGSKPQADLALGDAGREIFNKKIDACRRDFMALIAENRLEQDHYVLGSRFNSDDIVWGRIRGAAMVDEFFSNPEAWMMDGLRDCAGADHWYLYEKEW